MQYNTSKLEFTLDQRSRSPLFRQIQDQVRYAVSVGALLPGDALPSIRQLESELGVNRNTVRRAYSELAVDGLIVMRRGCEARVADLQAATSGECASRLARELAGEFLRRTETEGLDSLHFASLFSRCAHEHDVRYPRWCVVECSLRQAEAFAEVVAQYLHRKVIALELDALGSAESPLAPSLRHVLTPAWHVAEARTRLKHMALEVHAMTVRLSEACVVRVRQSAALSRVGLVVRDAHSVPGYREIVRERIGIEVSWALADDETSVRSLAERCGALIYTTPCDALIRRVVPKSTEAIELVFEPQPEALQELVSGYSTESMEEAIKP